MTKKGLIIIAVVLVYVFSISYALMYLPFSETPGWLASLFNKKTHGTLLWLKMRHLFVVTLLSFCLAWLLARSDRNNALINSLAVGALSVLWGVGFSWMIVGTIYFGWIEVTDYLVIALAIPLWTAVLFSLRRS